MIRSAKWVWLLFIAGLSSLVLFFALINFGLFGKLPSFDELENPKANLATEVYSNDGVLLGKYYSENRTMTTYDHLPKSLVNALLATEDARFYSHTGVDIKAVMRVFKGVIIKDNSGGGSTITQQLAKNLFPRERLNKFQLIMRKFKEWVIAVKLERSYTKEEIISMYLNVVPFSDNAYGISSASKTYFSKPVDSLNTIESAVLVGMLKAPSVYNPRLHPEASKSRRDIVLTQMKKYGFISAKTLDSLSKQPLVIKFSRQDHLEGPAPYFREELRAYMKAWCKKNKKPDGSNYDIYKDGLKIYTTIDSRMQQYAEESVEEHLKSFQTLFFNQFKYHDPWRGFKDQLEIKYTHLPAYVQLKDSGLSRTEIDSILMKPKKLKVFSWKAKDNDLDTIMSIYDSMRYTREILQAGFIVIDPESGYIKAWVGGANYKYFKFDHVNMGGIGRQVGSTFKPFVYTEAIRDKGYSPCFQIPNQLITFYKNDPKWHIGSNWTPHNSGGGYGGMMTLKNGLAYSVNTISARLMYEMSPEAVINLVREMGITVKIEKVPSICLGVADIPLIQIAGAYTTFINKGVYSQPMFIDRIEDKNGNVIQQFAPNQKEVLDEEAAYVMTQLLKGVVDIGTAKRLHSKYGFPASMDIAGKTGTTQSNSDGWFMGLTPELMAGVWVGCDDRYIRFRSTAFGQGAAVALPIWALFFKKVMADKELHFDQNRKFDVPKGDKTIELDCAKYDDPTIDYSKFGEEYEVEEGFTDSLQTP